MTIFKHLLKAILFLLPSTGIAGDFEVDKVYHPFVLPNEREVEWRFTSRQNDNGNVLSHQFAFGHALTANVISEFYIVAERDAFGDFGLQAYEIETRWMLTEQGQYWADWGLLFDIEKQHNKDMWEVTSGVLFEKELGRTSLTVNALATYEWGDSYSHTEHRFNGQIRIKYRYRWLPQLQPAIEFYSGKEYTGIGPAFMGIQRYSGQKQLKWEMAFIAGLNGDSKDHTLRVALEYEF